MPFLVEQLGLNRILQVCKEVQEVERVIVNLAAYYIIGGLKSWHIQSI